MLFKKKNKSLSRFKERIEGKLKNSKETELVLQGCGMESEVRQQQADECLC